MYLTERDVVKGRETERQRERGKDPKDPKDPKENPSQSKKS